MRGGSIWTSLPLWIPCLMSKYDKWYIINKLLCSAFRICKKFANLQNLNFLSPKFVQKMKNYTFQICKNFCKILINLIFNQEKLKMCRFPLTGCLQKFCSFFRKTCAIRFLMSKALQKATFYKNLTSGSGSKQRFSLLQEKQSFRQCAWGLRQLVLKPGFRPKGRALGM